MDCQKWTLARDTNSDNIVEVILPEVSVAEGLIFVEEVYSSIHSLKALNPNAVHTVKNPHLLLDNNNNNSFEKIQKMKLLEPKNIKFHENKDL